MEKYINADRLLKNLPNDLPYKGSVRRVLIQAHAADVVEVKHGKWEWRELYGIEGLVLVCSECRESEGACERFDYCPNCGTKMDGGKEE